jgi:hypothetical protein
VGQLDHQKCQGSSFIMGSIVSSDR